MNSFAAESGMRGSVGSSRASERGASLFCFCFCMSKGCVSRFARPTYRLMPDAVSTDSPRLCFRFDMLECEHPFVMNRF